MNRPRSTAHCTALYCAGTLPLLGMLWGLQAYALNTPDVLALYEPHRLRVMHGALAALMAWLAVLGALAWARRQEEEAPPGLAMAHAAVTPTVLMLVALCCGYGLLDTPMAMVVVEVLIIARALFPLRVLVPAMASGAALVLLNDILQWQGMIHPSALLVAPMFTGGSLSVWWKIWLAVVFNLSVLPFLVAMLSLFISLTRRRLELETLARTDMLTGLFNRREFMARLTQESQRHERSGQPVSVLMFDIDHFKAVNDTYGHPVGDAVLERVGTLLRTGLRQHLDVAARMGGEEFAVLVPETDLHGAQSVALKLCDAMRATHFEHQGQVFHVTLSAGVAEVTEGQGEAALHVADQLLYRAKSLGRDRVVTVMR